MGTLNFQEWIPLIFRSASGLERMVTLGSSVASFKKKRNMKVKSLFDIGVV